MATKFLTFSRSVGSSAAINSQTLSKCCRKLLTNQQKKAFFNHRCAQFYTYTISSEEQYSENSRKLIKFLKENGDMVSDDIVEEKVKEIEYNKVPNKEARAVEFLANMTPETEKQLKILKLHHQLMHERNPYKIAEEIPNWLWVDMLNSPSTNVHSKTRKMEFYTSVQKARQAEENKKLKKQEEEPLKVKTYEDGTTDNRIFNRIRDKTMSTFGKGYVCRSLIDGPHLVFDMSFDEYMRHMDISSLVRQLGHCHNLNAKEKEPFHFVFTGVNRNNYFSKEVFGRSMFFKEYVFTENNFTDLFPKKNLVYLTPDASTYLNEYNPDDVHIIGGLNDKFIQDKLTLAKAKQLNIRTAKLPIDKYIHWKLGQKTLCLNHIVEILIGRKNGLGWEAALECIPKRKLYTAEEVEEIRSHKMQALQQKQRKYERKRFDRPQSNGRWSNDRDNGYKDNGSRFDNYDKGHRSDRRRSDDYN